MSGAERPDIPIAVHTDGLTKVFDGPTEVHAVRPCSIRVVRGEYVAVTGPSGSGKSTLLSLLGLLEEASAGRYTLDGVDVGSLDESARAAIRAHKIGFVFQAFHLLGYRTVLDNVEMGLTYQGVQRRARRTLAREVVERVGLGHRVDMLCSKLSGGERQRVAIGRALVRRPALLLCDEPTGNLDSESATGVLDQIDEVHASGITVLVITHDRGVAARAQRHLAMHDGLVSEVGVSEVEV